MEKRGLSSVITVMIFIGITITLITIVWISVNSIVREELNVVGSCSGIIGKVNLDERYTCYDTGNDELQFSISLENIDVDGLLVAVSAGGTGKVFTLTPELTNVENVVTYPDRNENVKLPEKQSGLTYIYDLSVIGANVEPDKIEISPKINNNQCETSDSITEFPACELLV